LHKSGNLRLKFLGQLPNVQQQMLLHRAMISLDLAVSPGMIRRGEYVPQSFGLEILAKIPTHQGLAIVSQAPAAVLDRNILHPGKLTSKFHHITEGSGVHRRPELPGEYLTAVVVQYTYQIEPAPAIHF